METSAPSYHFGLKIVVIGQNPDMVRKFVDSVPGVEIEASESFRFLKVFSFQLFVSDSLVLGIDLWALPDDVKQRGDAQLLCCDACIVFYAAQNAAELGTLLNTFHKDIRTSNPHCKYVCCAETRETATGGALSQFGIQKVEAMDPNGIAFAFKATVASVVSEIPNPPDPVFLLHKNVKIGGLLLNDPSYKRALRPSFPQ